MGRDDKHNRAVLEAILAGKEPPKRPKSEYTGPSESQIQQTCIQWFMYQHNAMWRDGVLFHIPNEGLRTATTGKRMKKEGIVKGVADLCLAVPRHGYAALYIEMKTPKGYQSPEQRAWQAGITKYGNKYVVCKSFEDFKKEVTKYLGVVS